jgi:hypothetical protein
MAQQFITSSGAAVGPRIQEIDQTGVVVQRPVGYWRYVSWGAIIAGAVLAMATQLLLTLLGAGIGLVSLAATEAVTESETATGFGIGAGIWWLITGLISLFIGGLAAGRLARVSQATDGVFHGLLVWALTTILSVYLLTTAASALIGGTFASVNSYLQSDRPVPGVTDQVGGPGAQGDLMDRAAGAVGLDDRREPAAQPGQVGQDRTGQQAAREQQTEETAQEAASNVGQAALWSFFALALGAASAALGGSLGRHIFSRFDEPTTVVSRTPTVAPAATTPDNPPPRAE